MSIATASCLGTEQEGLVRSHCPITANILFHSQGCSSVVPANAIVIEWYEAPNGNATSLPAQSPQSQC